MKLNESKTECQINDVTVKVGESVDYRPAEDTKVSIGKVMKFKHPGFQECDVDSVWMLVKDAEDGGEHWVSVNNWYEQFKRTNNVNPSPEPEVAPEYPF